MSARHLFARVVTAGAVGAVLAAALVAIPAVDPMPEPLTTTVDRTPLSGEATRSPGWQKTVEGEANLVGVQWTGDPDAEFAIERRDRAGRWRKAGRTEQIDVLPDPGSLDARKNPTGHASAPVWVGNATDVRVRLVEGTARDLALQRVVAPPSEESSAVAGATTPNPPGIIPRAGWGADEGLRLANCPEGPQYDPRLDMAVVHHTDNTNGYSPDGAVQIIRSIYAYHTRSLGYCDIAYNFLIDRFGRVFEGRFGGVNRVVHGAHAIGFNTNTVGVAFIGNFDGGPPPAFAVDSAEALIAHKFGLHRVDPALNVIYHTAGNDKWAPGPVFMPRIVGHRDTWFTGCPGNGAQALLPGMRASVFARVYTAPPDRFPGWFGVPGQPKAMGVSGFGSLYPSGGQPWLWLASYWPGWDIVRDIEVIPGGGGAYVLDAYGGVHTYGSAPRLAGVPYFGFNVARDLIVISGTRSGYVLDAWGGIHAFGGAPPLRSGGYWPGWDIARKMARAPGGAYVLTGWGSVFRASQGASRPAALGGGPYWPGWDIARDIEVRSGVPGAYVLDGFGGVYALGGAPAVGGPYFGRDVAVGLSFVSGRPGGWVADRLGGISPFGGAPALSRAGTPFPDGIRAFDMQP